MVSSSKNISIEHHGHWWNIYGDFEQATEGMPHFGRIIHYYRKRSGFSPEDLARELGLKPRAIYSMEETQNMPRELTRRAALVQLLGIPAALLSVPTLTLLSDLSKDVPSLNLLDAESIGMYEDNLNLAWQLYYSYSAQVAAVTIKERVCTLSSKITQAHSVERDQLLSLKCRFLQLDGVSSRDRLAFNHSLAASKEAIEIAEHLGNAELLASALFRRARTYMAQGQYVLAVEDLQRAEPNARVSRDPLKSYVKICLAEAYSLESPLDRQTQRRARILLDDVGRKLRVKSVLDGDGSFTRVDIAGWSMEVANVYGRFGKGHLDSAREALEDARDTLGPQWTRWQGNLEIADASLSLHENDIYGCCAHIRVALPIIQGTKSKSNQAKLLKVFEQLKRQHPTHKEILTLTQDLSILV